MKKSKQILVLLLVMCAFISCEKADDEPEQMNEDNLENILGKWMVSNSPIYKSFEFTDRGVCIIVEKSMAKSVNDEIVNVGTYDLDDLGIGLIILLETGDTRILDDILLTPESASFTVTDPTDPDNAVMVQTEIVEEMEDTERTQLLARSWVLSRTTWNDISEGITEDVVFPGGYRGIVALSISGTYTTFISYNNAEERHYGNWMWVDNTETVIWEWTNDQSFGEAQQLTITALSQDLMVILATTPEGDIVTQYFSLEPSGYYW